MEISKDSPLFGIIKNHLDLLKSDDAHELVLSFSRTEGHFTELEFQNFTNVFRSLKYSENIAKETLQVSDVVSNDILYIEGMPNILNYCITNSCKKTAAKWYKSKAISSDTIHNIFDLNIDITQYSKMPMQSSPEQWDDTRKHYMLNKDINYTKNKHSDITYVANMHKASDDEFYTFKQSNVLKAQQNYGFKIIIKNDVNEDEVLSAIVQAMQAITMSTIMLTKMQQKEVIDEYWKLIKDDIEISYYNKRSGDIPLIAPKPVTLERANLIDPKEYGAVSILNGYTVTEKADGERILLYINGVGKVYMIDNTQRIQDTGMTVSQAGYNSLIDGEYITCHKRRDDTSKGLFAAFDIYYVGGKKVTSMPLIADDNVKPSRYNYLKQFEKLITSGKEAVVEFMAKEHKYSDNILKDSKDILTNASQYPYEIDGLIYTPTKLALYSYYTNHPVKITDNVKWDRVFKWKPDEQNTIDFLITIDRTITKNGIKYKVVKLFVGYNASQWEDIDIYKGLKLRYDKDFARQHRPTQNLYAPALFRPTIYYTPGIEFAHIRQTVRGDIEAENGDKLDSESIVEFRYVNDQSIPVSERWKPIRVREDKTRIFKKGILSKTANELGVAMNIWRSIHNPVTNAMIMGNEPVFKKEVADNADERLLDTDDVYYSRNIPRDSLLSIHMLNFHNQGIKKQLYDRPKKKGTLLELCCGEAGDLNRWLDAGYSFILGVDLVKRNIYNPKSGCYARMLKRRGQYMKTMDPNAKIYYPDMVFVAGDCSQSIRAGKAATSVNDKDSEDILKTVMNKHSSVSKHLKYITGKGADGFDAISCMFAIHYFFESEQKLDGFLQNVSENLKPNGVFFCTFMNGETVESNINKNGGDMIEGKKLMEDYSSGMPVWAIVRRYDSRVQSLYGKKIDVYIENTQKFIPEYLVSYKLLVDKAKHHGMELVETEMFEETFRKLKEKIPESEEDYSHLDQDILKLDEDNIQKQFSFLNQWAVFTRLK